MAEKCPCGSEKDYKACCGLFISGKAQAPTAEALMRARYSAYAKHEIGFLMDTILKDGDEDDSSMDPEGTRKWSVESDWKGLEILETRAGGPADEKGKVEFIARYAQKGVLNAHHEVSSFVKKGGRWYFESGKLITEQVKRESPKVGRNEPCPCGSGKKYKACCGK
jgi:SEC-C motif domain protein